MEKKENTDNVADGYFINQELVEEMVRLNRQGRIITEAMGGVLPEQRNLARIHDILDIACGPGEWALRVAQEYPDKRVIGVDVSKRMIEYAQAQATANNIAAQFRVMDVLTPLDFPDASFDLINMRLIFAFMNPERWKTLLAECMRVLRPGGILCVTEAERAISNNLIFERFAALWPLAFYKAHQTFSPDGLHYGQVVVLKHLLKEAGCHNLQHRAFALDFSSGAEAHDSSFFDALLGFKLAVPFLLKTGVGTQEELDDLFAGLKEIQYREDFCGYWFYMTVWGEKPE